MIKRSVTIVGEPVDFVYIIRDIDVDKIRLEKYSVKCSNNIESAWGDGQGNDHKDRTIEVVLQDKISEINLASRPEVIGVAAKNGGKIIKDFTIEKAKKGKKAHLSGLIFFDFVKDEE